jgi:hypothetical protein
MHFLQGLLSEVSAVAAEALSLGRDEGDARIVTFTLFLQEIASSTEASNSMSARV